MEIIDELEDAKRGIYAGCVGYFSANGEMDSCIVLRTSVVKDGVMATILHPSVTVMSQCKGLVILPVFNSLL